MILRIDTDLRAVLGPARDHGRRPTCLAFAASDAHRHARRHPAPLCVEWLHYHAIKRSGGAAEDGATFPDTRAVLRRMGQPEELVWPYSPTILELEMWNPPSGARVAPMFRRGSDECPAAMSAVRARLTAGSPVVLGLFVSTTWYAPGSWTRVGGETILGVDRGEPVEPAPGHAAVAVGAGRYEGEPMILLRNSWGAAWAAKGHAWAYDRYLEPRLIGAFTVR